MDKAFTRVTLFSPIEFVIIREIRIKEISALLFPPFTSDLREDVEVMPRERRVGFLMMIGFQDQIPRREQNFLHVGILPDFLARRRDNEFVEIAFTGGAIFHALAFKRHPINT